MANKNSKRILTAARKAFKKGELVYQIEVPTGGFHNNNKGAFTTRRIEKCASMFKRKAKPFPQPNKDGMTMVEQRAFWNGPWLAVA